MPEDITSVLKEDRVFNPSPDFCKKAHLNSLEDYEAMYRRSIDDPDGFWSEQAEKLHWFKKWDKVLEWNEPFAKWFVGAKTNLSYNCLDRHLGTWRKNKAALIWEGEPGDSRVLTYQDLHREVCKFANVLKSLDVKAGDRVIIYMPQIPETAIAMLACARIGATHS
ncbi:MAG: acetyl-coenzyme A synthetase N-terminal domain-containing protein, partial [bacterium]